MLQFGAEREESPRLLRRLQFGGGQRLNAAPTRLNSATPGLLPVSLTADGLRRGCAVRQPASRCPLYLPCQK